MTPTATHELICFCDFGVISFFLFSNSVLVLITFTVIVFGEKNNHAVETPFRKKRRKGVVSVRLASHGEESVNALQLW